MLQNYAMAVLGMFVFTQKTVPFQTLERESNWRHPTNSVVGGMPKAQFTGKEGEKVTISGRLMPEITGGRFSIKMLELMADSGGSFPLIDGATFELVGFFVIESLQETRSEMFGDGAPRVIDFTLNLKRTDDPMLIAVAEKIMSLI